MMTLYPVMADNSTAETQDTFLQEAETFMTYKVAKYIDMFWFPVLIPLRLVGNTLSFLVMMRSNNRKVSTCIYMAAISINDNAMMFWALWYLHSFENKPVFCKIIAFISYLILQNSTFQILAMTIDKYIAIRWPHRAAAYITPKRAKNTICTIFILVTVYNLPHFFITSLIEGQCYGYSVKSILTKVHSWLSFVLNGVIPYTLLIHVNYVIVKTVRNSRRMFRSRVGTEKRQKSVKSAENQLTTMLLLVTSLFMILLFTTYIRFIYASFVISDTPSKFASYILIFEMSYKLYVTNSGINFFLYCISGNKFRNDLKELVCCVEGLSSSSVESRSNRNTSSTIEIFHH